jgi:hypothetical protein
MEQVLTINHGDQFQPPREPVTDRLLTEKVVNSRESVITFVTDHTMLQPLAAPGTRIGQWQYAFTDGPVEIFDPTADGAKVDIQPGVRPDSLQDQLPIHPYQTNTYRQEAEPWDERLIT